MKAFVVACALFAVASAAPNQYGGGSMSYGGGSYGGSTRTIQMQPAGHPSVHNVPNNYGYSNSVTYTAPGQSYQAAPVTYAAPMLTFTPPDVYYNGQSVTYATASSSGYGSGTQAYQPASGYSAPANPTVQNYQPSSSGYSAPMRSSGY